MTSTKPETIWNRTFTLLCVSQFLGYAQNYTLQPTMPLYVTHLGGSPFIVGLVIACFSVTSVLFRPSIGNWADRWSESGVMILGMLAQAISLLLCLVPFVSTTMLANAFRGIGWAGMTAGGYTLLAISAPDARRGEAAGYYRGVQSSAQILFPAVALWIIDAQFGGFNAAFIVAMAMALLAAAAGLVLWRHTPHDSRAVPAAPPESWWRDVINVFDRSILLPAVLLFTLNLSIPCLTGFFVIYAREIGIGHFGWYFVVTGTTSLIARPLLGRFSDKLGYGRSLLAAFTLQTISLLSLTIVTNLSGAMLSGVLYYLGSAIGGATIFALAMEKAPPDRRGRAMASFSVSLPLSTGMGSLLSGLVIDMAGYIWMFLMLAALCTLGFVLTGKFWAQLR